MGELLSPSKPSRLNNLTRLAIQFNHDAKYSQAEDYRIPKDSTFPNLVSVKLGKVLEWRYFKWLASKDREGTSNPPNVKMRVTLIYESHRMAFLIFDSGDTVPQPDHVN